jgi:hypothetical protein
MPRDWYLDQIAERRDHRPGSGRCAGRLPPCRQARRSRRPARPPPPGRGRRQAAAHHRRSGRRGRPAPTGPALIADRFGAWAGGYFDQGQALWAAPRGKGAWPPGAPSRHPRPDARDRGPHRLCRACRRRARNATRSRRSRAPAPAGPDGRGARHLLPPAALLAGRLGAGTAATSCGRRNWPAAATPRSPISWPSAALGRGALPARRATPSPTAGPTARDAHAAPSRRRRADRRRILQEAAERAAQRDLAETLAAPAPAASADRPALQAAFCIDVRSEVFRRALEAVDPSIRRWALPASSACRQASRFASDVDELRLPVLLNPAVGSTSGGPEDAGADLAARYAARATGPGAGSSWPPCPPSPSSRRWARSMSASSARRAGARRHAGTRRPRAPLDPALDLDAASARRRRCCGPCR